MLVKLSVVFTRFSSRRMLFSANLPGVLAEAKQIYEEKAVFVY